MAVNRERLASNLIKLAKCLVSDDDNNAAKQIADAFGLGEKNVKDVEVIGTGAYAVAIGSVRGKWYGAEAKGRSPQVWEARSRRDLLKKISEDTGVTASSKVASPEGYRENLKRTLNNLEKDLKEYKSMNRSATSGDKIAGELVRTAKELVAYDEVLISGWDNWTAYFARKSPKSSLEGDVFDLVVETGDVITMGKIIGTPKRFWSTKDKANRREYGIGNKFQI
jgi:hypothetical protein